jgi:hypothetical protein
MRKNLFFSLTATFGLLLAGCQVGPEPYIVPGVVPPGEPGLITPRPEMYKFDLQAELFGKPFQFDSKYSPELALNDIFIGQVDDPNSPRTPTVEVWSEIQRLVAPNRRTAAWQIFLFLPSIEKVDFSATTWANLLAPGSKPLGKAPFRIDQLPRTRYGFVFNINDRNLTGAPGEFTFHLVDEPGTVFKVVESRIIPNVEGWSAAREVTFAIEGNLYEESTGKVAGTIKNARLTTRFFYTDVE